MNLASAFGRQRQVTPDVLSAVWVRWAGQGLHVVELRPSGAQVTASGSNQTYFQGQKLHVGRTTRGDGRSYSILGPPPVEGRGAASYPLLLSQQEAAEPDISAATPTEVEIGVATDVYLIGYNFTESPLTQFAAYDPVLSDPVAGTWVDDANVTVGTEAWVDTASPPAAVDGLFLAGQTIVKVPLTLAAVGTASLRVV